MLDQLAYCSDDETPDRYLLATKIMRSTNDEKSIVIGVLTVPYRAHCSRRLRPRFANHRKFENFDYDDKKR